MKSSSRRDGTPERHDLHLAELLDFRPDQGIIRLHEQRVVILSAAAMGLLRKELVDTLGLETARTRSLLRFGFADGYHDAVNLRDRSKWTNPLDGLRAGAMLHTLEGIVRADVRRLEHDAATGRFEEEVVWHDSYEAEQHVHHYGKSVCAGVLVAGRVRQRLRQRVSGEGNLLPRDGVRGQGAQALRGDRARRGELGGRHRSRSAPTSRRPISATKSSACARPSARA